MSVALKKIVKEFNGVRGDARSFDRLEELLAEQAYLLCFWRVAADEINYRRFFDINELAAIRVEEPEVFSSVHGGFPPGKRGPRHGAAHRPHRRTTTPNSTSATCRTDVVKRCDVRSPPRLVIADCGLRMAN